MSETINEIILRPRFKFEVASANETLLKGFEVQKTKQNDFVVSRVDDHVFIRFPKHLQHYWSPQLHLEINEIDQNSCTVHGLFGPNPTVWTLFMFLHFVVAGLFIAFGIWWYTNAVLGENYTLQVALTSLTVVCWFLLYFIGRIGKSKGTPEMYKLHAFMRDTLRDYR
jgi:hypothetical protein